MRATAIAADLEIGGFTIRDLTAERLAADLDRSLAERRKHLLFFANANLIVKCQHLRDAMSAPSVTVVNDGIAMRLAALASHGHGFLANLNGTDFTPFYLAGRTEPTRVFLFGSAAEDVAAAARVLTEMPNVEIVGVRDGFGFRERQAELVAEINAARADIVLVGLGNPLQEEWALAHGDALDAPVIMGVGALFVWLSGRKTRAPRLVQRLNLEWAYRLACEPRRLAERYTLGIARFAALCAAHHLVARSAARAAGDRLKPLPSATLSQRGG